LREKGKFLTTEPKPAAPDAPVNDEPGGAAPDEPAVPGIGLEGGERPGRAGFGKRRNHRGGRRRFGPGPREGRPAHAPAADGAGVAGSAEGSEDFADPAQSGGGLSGGNGLPGAPGESDPLPIYADTASVGLDANDPRRRNAGRGSNPRNRPADSEDFPKLHKLLADSGLGSRRDMEELIVSGRVSVNGQPAHIGQRIAPTDQVRVNGRAISRRAQPDAPRVLLYHKPAGEISSRDDPEQRATVFERLPKLKGARWVAVGRLDFNTEGLMIFTTSGDLANRLMHPRYGWEREYAVRILGRIDDEARDKLLAGVELEDGPAAFSRIDDVGGDGANHWYRVVIGEGRNREVRRMFEAVGLSVSRLVRIRFGPVGLPRQLSRGRWVELSDPDVQSLLQVLRPVGGAAAPDSIELADSPQMLDRDDDDHDDEETWDDDRQPDFGPLPGDEPAFVDPEQQDDEWQPRSANAHLEGITRLVRNGDGSARKGPGQGAGGAKRFRGARGQNTGFGAGNGAGGGAARGGRSGGGMGGNTQGGRSTGGGPPKGGPAGPGGGRGGRSRGRNKAKG
jgi:23S rRNA pseudouridine2605 synthase